MPAAVEFGIERVGGFADGFGLGVAHRHDGDLEGARWRQPDDAAGVVVLLDGGAGMHDTPMP